MLRTTGLFLLQLVFLILPGVAASLSGMSIPSPIQKVVVVGGTHGNEYTGVWCIKAMDRKQKEIKEEYPSLDISTLLAHPEAWRKNKRFIHEDLNRQFSLDALQETSGDGMPKTVESLRAREINEILGPKFSSLSNPRTDVIVDLHTTTTNMGITIIVAEGDHLMTRAAAYVLAKCGSSSDIKCETRCLMHTHPSREVRPNLSSTGTHGFTIEVGPVPQGVIRHDAVENTQKALAALLQFLHRHNQEPESVHQELVEIYAKDNGRVPCYRSAPAKRQGEMSGKIVWPTVEDNPNFPALMVHKHLQDRDFELLHTGDPLFVDLDGKVIPYDGSHGSPVHLVFVNEGGYYYSSSGTGIGVAISSKFDLMTGYLVPEEEGDGQDEL